MEETKNLQPIADQPLKQLEKASDKPSDFTEQEFKLVKEYEADGCPGLIRVSQNAFERMRKAYLQGSRFETLSKTFEIPKKVVMFIAYKEGWGKAKTDLMELTSQAIKENISFNQADNVLFLMELSSTLKEYYRKRIQLYQKTDDDKILQTTSLNALEKYLKIMKLLQESVSGAKDSVSLQQPSVHVHVSEGSQITVAENTNNLDSNKKIAEALSLFADLKRANEGV
jgi:hypothetical protein